jgi:glycosyltransferase involved in cell wall biosynthesis
VRILLVSSMWPGAADPDFGVFVHQVARGLEERGHAILPAVVDHRGGSKAKQASLARDALRHALRSQPDVVYAHYLLPAGVVGAVAATAARVPLVLTAHGRDVRNAAANPAIRVATGAAVRRAAAVVAVSGWLRDELHRELPEARSKTHVVDCGVDLGRFAPRDQGQARARLGLEGLPGPLVVFVGGLDDRKNVVRLRDAVLGIPDATLLAVGDGPLRAELTASDRIRAVGRVPHDEVPAYMAAADVVALPSVVEPFGPVILEAMAMERPVLATSVGGPAELVTEAAGALADPHDVAAIRAGLHRAIALGVPNPAGREAAAAHGLDLQLGRIEALLRDVSGR